MRWLQRLIGQTLLETPASVPIPMQQWDAWAQQLAHGQLRHDVYVARLLNLPHIVTLGWLAPGSAVPQPLPFNNHLRNVLVLPIFTGTDALRRFAEIQQMDRPLVLALPTPAAWTMLAGLEVGALTINAGGPTALTCDMDQVLALAEAARKRTAQ